VRGWYGRERWEIGERGREAERGMLTGHGPKRERVARVRGVYGRERREMGERERDSGILTGHGVAVAGV